MMGPDVVESTLTSDKSTRPRFAQKAQNYTVHTTIAFFTHGLNNRSRR
jgi:hypothetical protein